MNNTLTVGDRTYYFGDIPAVEAVRVEIAIVKIIGEPLFKAMVDSKDGDKLSVEAIGASAIGLLTSRMDADELINTIEIVLKYVTCNGSRIEINSAFTGRNKELWLVFLGGLRYNFRDFFGALDSILPQDVKTKLSSSNPPTSTGMS